MGGTRRGIALAALCCLCVAGLAGKAGAHTAEQDSGAVQWRVYSNARFGYDISYPAFFVPQREADNGDGRRFTAEEYHAGMAAWGSVFLAGDLEAEYAEALKIYEEEGAEITYAPRKGNWFVLSGFLNDEIFYRKTVVRDTRSASFEIRYPVSSRDVFDALVARIAGEFGIVRPGWQ